MINVKAVLRRGCGINGKDEKGNSPLMQILNRRDCRPEAIRMFLDHGANINSTNKSGDTPLISAIYNMYNLEVIRLLLERGADNNMRESSGFSPIHIAIQRFQSDQLAIFELLLSYGSDVNSKTNSGDTPLHLALIYPETIYTMKMIKLLLNQGADINITDEKGNSALVYAVRMAKFNIDVYKFLLDQGADINIKYQGSSLLHLAVYNIKWNRLDVVKLLVDRGMSVNVTDEDGDTPLSKAIKHPLVDINIIKFLLKVGADVNMVNNRGKSPLHRAMLGDISMDIVMLLIEHGALVEVKDYLGRSLLHRVIYNISGTLEVIKFLLDYQDVNAVDESNNTLLHYAASTYNSRNISIVKLLVDRKADINAINSDKETPLMYLFTTRFFDRDLVNVLLQYGAQINVGNECSSVVLQQIIEKSEINEESLECFKLLIKYAFLQNNFSVEDVFEGCKDHAALSKFASDCLAEIQQMHCEKVCNLTIYELLVKHGGNYDITEILRVLDDNKYTLYREDISFKVSKLAIINKFEELWIHTVKRSNQQCIDESIMLHYHSFRKIIGYLSNLDALNLILALHRKTIQMMDFSYCSSQRNKNDKRCHIYSTKSVKRLKLFDVKD